MKSRTYIVILNYKSWKDTIECLESVLKSDNSDFQIILVDNSPTNESIKEISAWATGNGNEILTAFPDLVYPLEKKPIKHIIIEENTLQTEVFDEAKLLIVKANENKGFSAGNNIALRYIKRTSSKNDKIWLLNNDTVVPKNTLSELLKTNRKNINSGIIGAKLLEYENPKIIQSIGGKYNPWLGKISILGSGEHAGKIYEEEDVDFDYPIGASMFMDSTYLMEIGLMEEKYFLYFEEYDWVLRGLKKGYKSVFSPKAIIYHKGGSSSGGGTSKLADFYGIRSKLLFTRKFFSYKLPFLYGSFIFFIINRIRRKQFDRIPMLFKLIVDTKRRYNETNN